MHIPMNIPKFIKNQSIKWNINKKKNKKKSNLLLISPNMKPSCMSIARKKKLQAMFGWLIIQRANCDLKSAEWK